MPLPRDQSGPLRVYKLFLSHAWDYDDDYERLVKLLNNAADFHWRNLSVPSNDRIHNLSTAAEVQDALAFYIRKADCVLICAGMYCAHRTWIQAEMDIARDLGKPIIGIELWAQERTPIEVQDSAATMVGWNTESIVRAIRAICPEVVPRLVHISFSVSPSVPQWAIDAAVGQVSVDWYRYAWNCYLAWTTLSTEAVTQHIRRVPGLTTAYCLVSGMREDDAYAFFPNSIWTWLSDKV